MHGLGGALALGKQEKGKEEMEWRSGKHPVVVCYLGSLLSFRNVCTSFHGTW